MSQVILRSFGDDDVALFKQWLYLPHVAKWYHDPLDWIDEIEKRNSDYVWLHHFIALVDEKPIGFCQYYEYCNSGEDWHGNAEIEGTYSIDYMIGDSAYLAKGYGKAMIRLLIEMIKSVESAASIIVQPEQENKPSCNTLLSCGFYFDEANEIYKINL